MGIVCIRGCGFGLNRAACRGPCFAPCCPSDPAHCRYPTLAANLPAHPPVCLPAMLPTAQVPVGAAQLLRCLWKGAGWV